MQKNVGSLFTICMKSNKMSFVVNKILSERRGIEHESEKSVLRRSIFF